MLPRVCDPRMLFDCVTDQILGSTSIFHGGQLRFSSTTLLLLFVVVHVLNGEASFPVVRAEETISFFPQNLGKPFRGEHTGVALADVNGDGYDDLLFSAGRHTIDQSYVLINLGRNDTNGRINFSPPLRLGNPGGYYQVDTFQGLSTLAVGHTAVLLAGGGNARSITKAVLLDVVVTGCSIEYPDIPCDLSWSTIWTDPSPQSDRNGAFATTIQTPGARHKDPAIVLTSLACIAIYLPHPSTGNYGESSFVLTPEEKDLDANNNINRATGLAVGYVGSLPGIVVGSRTLRGQSPPAPLIAIVQDPGKPGFRHFTVDEGLAYDGNVSEALQAVTIVLDDFDGDGTMDIATANYVSPPLVDPQHPVPQMYYQLAVNGAIDEGLSIHRHNAMVLTGDAAGRSVDSGGIFYTDGNEFLPDLVYATSDSTVHFMANLGMDYSSGSFLGFQERAKYTFPISHCEIRDIQIANLEPCTVSIICATICGLEQHGLGNVILHSTQRHCVPQPTSTRAPTPFYQHTRVPSQHPSAIPTDLILSNSSETLWTSADSEQPLLGSEGQKFDLPSPASPLNPCCTWSVVLSFITTILFFT